MKQTLFMILATLFGTFGAFISPFYGVAVYYMLAVLRPQYIWVWAIPSGIRWSLYVAIATIVSAFTTGNLDTEAAPAERAGTRRFSGAHFATLVFSLWIVVTTVTAQDRDASWPWLVEYLKIFLMFFVSSRLVRTLRQVWVLLIVTALSVGYIAYEVNFAYLSSGYMGIYYNGYGGLDNNGAGLMMAIAVPLCIFIYLGTTRWWRWIFASLVPVLLHAVLMTYSRGAMVSLLVASPFIFVRGRNKVQLAAAALAITLLVPVLAGKEIRARFFTLQSYEQDGSAQSRFASWNAAFHIALDYPIFGVGIRNANLFSKEYGADSEGRTIHSQFLQILADAGFPGLFFYTAAFGSVLISLRRVRRWAAPGDDDDARLAYSVACGIEGGLAVFCVGSLFLSLDVFELPYVLLLLGAQLPIVVGLGKSAGPALEPRHAFSHPTPRPARRVTPAGTPAG